MITCLLVVVFTVVVALTGTVGKAEQQQAPGSGICPGLQGMKQKTRLHACIHIK
jgi:hypothetical protein